MFGLLTRTVCYLVNPIFKILDYIGYGNSVALLLTINFGLKLFGFIANRIKICNLFIFLYTKMNKLHKIGSGSFGEVYSDHEEPGIAIMTKHPETFILFMLGYLYLFGFVALASIIIWISLLE